MPSNIVLANIVKNLSTISIISTLQYTLVCRQQSAGVPITFLLGFYVHLITRRWWEQVTNQRPGYGHVTSPGPMRGRPGVT